MTTTIKILKLRQISPTLLMGAKKFFRTSQDVEKLINTNADCKKCVSKPRKYNL
jgi:hypothetical protein